MENEHLRELFDLAIDQRDGLREIIQEFVSEVRWKARRTENHAEVPLSLLAKLDNDLLTWATAPCALYPQAGSPTVGEVAE